MSSDIPIIVPRDQHTISRKDISPNVQSVLHRLIRHGHTAYIVGGGVRDLLLDRQPKDLDVATSATPSQIKKIFRNCRLIGRRFRLAHIHFPDEIIEVATFRAPPDDVPADPPADAAVTDEQRRRDMAGLVKSEDGMILRDNVYGTPAQDAWRRDFTINALFYNIQDFSIIDYVGGLADLRQKFIRSIGDPHQRFVEDPVRMVRAVRFAAKLGLRIEPETYRALVAHREKIALASSERMYEETLKLFRLGAAEETCRQLISSGLFGLMFPPAAPDDSAAGREATHRLLQAARWLDNRVRSGAIVSPGLIYALLFGNFLEKWTREHPSGAPPNSATYKQTIEEFVAAIAPCVQIPRSVSLGVREILANQWRFQRTRPRSIRAFTRMPFFPEALLYFRFTVEATGEGAALVELWDRVHKGEPPPETSPADEGPAPGRRKRRRRRHRRGRGSSPPNPSQRPPDIP